MKVKTHPRLLIIESHPIQYRAPVYARLEQLCPGAIHVAYASDFSVRGGQDPGFAIAVSWDGDLLAGYPFTVLNPHLSHAPTGWNGLDGRGLPALITRLRPSAILLTSLNYRVDHVAYATALSRGIPIWMRCETQDRAFSRSWLKDALRSAYYRLLYAGIRQAFPIGLLNRQHWLRHGLKPSQLHAAHYCTPDRAAALTADQRHSRREALRHKLGLHPHCLLVGFFGKLIPKKDPLLLLEALPLIPETLRQRMALVYVGSGPLQHLVQQEATVAQARDGVAVHCPGFVNQSALVDWYLAADVVVLPSRRAGETWGLVVNEAMQAGCSVVVSEAVGCAADFSTWERFRTIPVGSAPHLALALEDLAGYPRSFDWASEGLQNYSIEAAAQALAVAITELT
jgi:glycosyltransferase involved in cell wall biosynthesis